MLPAWRVAIFFFAFFVVGGGFWEQLGDPMLELDKAEIPAVVEFVNAGKAGEEKDFKYVGKLKKADVLAMIKDGEMGALVKNFKFQE